MKKFRKIMAVLVAAMMIMATMVPAWAAGKKDSGRMIDQTGTITVSNPDNTNETYYAYKILDLASFEDGSVQGTAETPENENALNADQHASDAYAYVIATNSPWLTFVQNAEISSGTKYFTVGTVPITILNATTQGGGTNHNEYYVVKPTPSFANGFTNNVSDHKDETTAKEWTSAALAQKLAQAAIYYATGEYESSETDATSVISNPATSENQATILASRKTLTGGTASGLDLGYYVVNSTMGTLCALDTTNKTATIMEKNEQPALEKLVQEDQLIENASGTLGDEGKGYVLQNDADEGQLVFYRTKITVKKGAEAYVLHDMMDAGLTYQKGSIKVYFLTKTATETEKNAQWIELKDAGSKITSLNGGTTLGAQTYPTGDGDVTADSFYTIDETDVIYDEGATDATDDDVAGAFEVSFNQDFLTFLSDQIDGDTNPSYRIMVTYKARLNSSAIPDELGVNQNHTKLSYGEKPTFTTPEQVTSTATWSMKVYKFNEAQNRGALDGAHFQILNESGTVLRFVKTATDGVYKYYEAIQTDANLATTIPAQTAGNVEAIEVGKYNETEETNSTQVWDVVDTLTTNDGYLKVIGLDGASYKLRETLAPRGYNQMEGDLPFHIVSVWETTAEATTASKDIIVGAAKVTVPGALVYHDANAEISNNTYKTIASTAAPEAGKPDLRRAIPVENTTSAELPSTGGMGTTVLYIVGGMLVILAGAYLFFSRKRTA